MNNNPHLQTDKSFTLMELMICVVVIGLLASFGIPNYQKSIRKGYERNAIMNLKTIHGASQIYFAKYDDYAPGIGLNLTGINSVLGLNIVDTNMAYSYTGPTGGIPIPIFSVTATYTGGVNFTVFINEAPISANNPCCQTAGACQIVPDC